MNKLKSASIAAVLLTAIGATSTVAVAGPKHHQDKKMHHKEMLIKKLDLTEAQEAQMKASKAERQAKLSAVKEKMKVIKKELHQVMQSEHLDENVLRSLLQQEASLKAQRMAQKHASAKSFNEMLTEEQKAKFAELKARVKQKKAMHKEKRQARIEARKAKTE